MPDERPDGLAWVDGELTPVRYVRAERGDACPVCGEPLDVLTFPHKALGMRGLAPHPGWPTCRNGHEFVRPR